MTDRIMLQNLRFEATHGYHEYEQHIAQPFGLHPRAGRAERPQADGDVEDAVGTGTNGCQWCRGLERRSRRRRAARQHAGQRGLHQSATAQAPIFAQLHALPTG